LSEAADGDSGGRSAAFMPLHHPQNQNAQNFPASPCNRALKRHKKIATLINLDWL
jgi:hypothetical protein